PADPQYPIRSRRSPLAFRLLAGSAWDAHIAVAHARAFGERNESRKVPRATSESGTRALPRIAVAPGTQDRSRTDVPVRRDAVARSERRLRRSDVGRGENKNLHSRDEPGWRGKFDRASRIDRRPRHHFARRLAARVDRTRKRRRPHRGPRSGARTLNRAFSAHVPWAFHESWGVAPS